MGQPNRHGQNWLRAPTVTPTQRGGDPVAVRGRVTPTGPHPEGPNIIPIREMNAWIRSLPPETISHQVISDEARYNHALKVGESLTLTSKIVTENYVWIFSDVDFYATAPATAMLRPPKNLDPEALVGILRWELLFGGASPLQTVARRFSPYTTPAQRTASAPPTTSGWPWLGTPFGVQRMPTFALYAKGNEELRVVVTVEAQPRFPISRLGANLHGFSVPASLFPNAWT